MALAEGRGGFRHFLSMETVGCGHRRSLADISPSQFVCPDAPSAWYTRRRPVAQRPRNVEAPHVEASVRQGPPTADEQRQGSAGWAATAPAPAARAPVFAALPFLHRRSTAPSTGRTDSLGDTVTYETATYCYSAVEMTLLNDSTDFRRRIWLLMDRRQAEELSKFRTALAERRKEP